MISLEFKTITIQSGFISSKSHRCFSFLLIYHCYMNVLLKVSLKRSYAHTGSLKTNKQLRHDNIKYTHRHSGLINKPDQTLNKPRSQRKFQPSPQKQISPSAHQFVMIKKFISKTPRPLFSCARSSGGSFMCLNIKFIVKAKECPRPDKRSGFHGGRGGLVVWGRISASLFPSAFSVEVSSSKTLEPGGP